MGVFAAPIGYRMAYDTDGTAGFYFPSGSSVPASYNSGHMVLMNNESADVAVGIWRATYVHGLIFPELRDINGYYFNIQLDHDSRAVYDLQTSGDTTNGADGTWTTRISSPSHDRSASDNGFWRRRAVSITPLTNVKGVRLFVYNNDTHGIRTMHFYGQPTAGQNPNRLIFWKPSTAADLILDPADLDPGDGGDVMRGQTYNKTFRVKNNSSTLTATNVTVSAEILTDTNPSVQAMYSFSYQGGTFAPTIVVPSIAPGALSDDITVRFAVSSSATNVATSPRLRATPESMA